MVVVVKIKNGRVADWKGGVRDWSLTGEDEDEDKEEDDTLVNGVVE